MVIYSGGIFVELKIKPNKILMWLSYNCLFFSIMLKMLYQTNQNSTIRLLGFGMQAIVLLCYFLEELITLKRKSINCITLILGILVVYQCVITILNDSIYLPYTPIDIFIWPLSVIVYYNFTCHNEMNKNTENKTLIYYFIMCLISVFLIKIHLAGNGNIGQVVFLTYYCLTALPLVVIFVKGKNSRNLCILLCVAISVVSTKRTGTIALILGIFVMLVLDAHIQGSLKEKWKRYMYLFIAICIGSGAVLYLENRSGLEIFDRFSKLSTDGGSGRDVIWAITLQAFNVSNLREKIWGHGFQSVYYRLRPGGFSRFSHNSYIEYLYDYGIIGLSLLVLFVLFLIIIEIKFIREKNKYAPVMGMLLIITIFLSAFSYFFEESNIIQPIAVAYGIILGQAYKERKRYEN